MSEKYVSLSRVNSILKNWTSRPYRDIDGDWTDPHINTRAIEKINELPTVELEPGKKYRHFKGGIYEVIGKAEHTEARDELVLYKDKDGKILARPAFLFYGRTYDGQLRFTPIEEGET